MANLDLLLEDLGPLLDGIPRESGLRRQVLVAEVRARLGRADAADPRVAAVVAEVQRLAEAQP